jgi:hypothetical protein
MPEEDIVIAKPEPRSGGPKKWVIGSAVVIVLLVVAFMLGFAPMWWKAHRLAGDLAGANHELRLNQWQNELGSAAIDARRGEYESARQSASRFFSELSDEMGKTTESAFTPQQIGQLRSVLGPRDEIITLLARNDPVSADKLTAMHVAFRAAIASPPASK